MSSRKSSSSRETLPSTRLEERTPLKSLENEIQYYSTPVSEFRSKKRASAEDVKSPKAAISFCLSQALLSLPTYSKEMKASPSLANISGKDGETGDVTFKPFLCTGGEVEIPQSSVCEELPPILPLDIVGCSNDTNDTVEFHSMIDNSYCGHEEHPYSNVHKKKTCPADVSTSGIGELPPHPAFYSSCTNHNEEKEVSGTSSDYGGKMEVPNANRSYNDTTTEDKCPSQSASTELTTDGHPIKEEHDHKYNFHELLPVTTPHFEVTNRFKQSTDTSIDIILKSLSCTGGEIEIFEEIISQEDTVPLPATSAQLGDLSATPSILASNNYSQCDISHQDHPYCNFQNDCSSQSDNSFANLEIQSKNSKADGVEEQENNICHDQEAPEKNADFGSPIANKWDINKADEIQFSEMVPPLTGDKNIIGHPQEENLILAASPFHDHHEHLLGHPEFKIRTMPPFTCESSIFNPPAEDIENEILKSDAGEILNHVLPPADHVCSVVQEQTSALDSKEPTVSEQTLLGCISQQDLEPKPDSGLFQSSEVKDSALGSSSNCPLVCNSAEKPLDNNADVLRVLSECHSLASALKLGIFSPTVERLSMSLAKTTKHSTQDKPLADESILDREKSGFTLADANPVVSWTDHLESPISRPLFNSTAVGNKLQPNSVPEQHDIAEMMSCALSQPEVKNPVQNVPFLPDAQLQQQLRQMAEFLFLASGKMGPAAVSSCAPSRPMKLTESHSVGAGTSPVKLVEHSVNTSGLFERKKEISVTDSCTLTDPLLWNLSSTILENLPREELEQRLRSSMIMVEALVQQLAAARLQGRATSHVTPSELREKLVQTDHTELSQTSMYKDLYTEALSRIEKLELDSSSLQDLLTSMEDVRIKMASLMSDTDVVLCDLKEIDAAVRGDHLSLTSDYEKMKDLLQSSKKSQTKMMEKVKEFIAQRNDMRTRMEEAFTEKEATATVMDQLRRHCSAEISALEESVGCQRQLLNALNQTYPEQVALAQMCSDALNSAHELLYQTMDEHSDLMNELCTVRNLLQKTAPTLVMLNEKAARALMERDQHISAKDEANAERDQMKEELSETTLNLQTANQQIGDLNLQVTILDSEMSVLRQKLAEEEEEKARLDRKATELSATISSTLASYTFLEQALASETTKSQQSWRDAHEANVRANQLEVSLGESAQQVSELSQALALSEQQLGELRALSHSQASQIHQLQDVCAQLSNVREINEFLQMENELAREQVNESECLMRTNLQSLRERNIQCEDLKGEVDKLLLENNTLRQDISVSQSTAEQTRLVFEDKMAQVVMEITLLHHTVRGIINELRVDQKQQDCVENDHTSLSSFVVDNVAEGSSTEKEKDAVENQPEPSDKSQSKSDTLFSETSAFIRVLATRESDKAAEVEQEVEEGGVAELLSGLASTVSELSSTLKLVRRRNDAQLEDLQQTISSLQMEQEAAVNKHESEVESLKHQLSRLNTLAEKGNQALHQKAQDEKMFTKLLADVQEAQEILNKHKLDNNELRKDVVELRRYLQDAQVENQVLREELRKGQSETSQPTFHMEEKIKLWKQVERLKASLQEAEQARVKLLDRAKRHQIIYQTNQQKSENELQILSNMINKVRECLQSLPDVVKNCEQLQQLVEYIG